MIKDIPRLKVEDLAIAILPPAEDSNDELWDVYLINLQEELIQSVLITSRGYGELAGEKRKTATLRHFFAQIGPLQIEKIEPLPPALFNLTNEYWVSFSLNDHLYDKKYIFVQGSIDPSNFTMIPFLNRKGVMIR